MVLIKARPSYYNSDQLDAYLQCLKISFIKGQPTIQNLTLMVHRHLVTFPWEDTELHYTASRTMDVSSAGVYRRFVEERKGGGYCFAQNTLMLGMILAMGYRAYCCTGYINDAPDPLGIHLDSRVHMVIVVQLPDSMNPVGETYIVDVGYGLGIIHPMPLRENEEMPGVASPERHRLITTTHPESSLDSSDAESAVLSRQWRLQVNMTSRWTQLAEGEWRTLYQFDLGETYMDDLVALSFEVANRRQGIFWDNVMAVVYFVQQVDEVDGDLGMKVMIGRKVTQRQGGHITVLEELKTEEDRIIALKKYYGIEYSIESAVFISQSGGALKI